ncbi:MAG: MarR family transcriptional regulator [Chloroflexi bacterium]|nr:MarR family transcriptional regulator [Chloroflexota bacterium]
MTDRAKLTQETIELEQLLGRAIARSAPDAWMDLGLTIVQLKSLSLIDLSGNTNVRTLAASLNVTPPDITRIVDRLVEQGLVDRRENPKDRRMILLQTTEQGRTLLSKLRETKIAHMRHVLARLTLEELRALNKGLDALARAAEAGPGEDQP